MIYVVIHILRCFYQRNKKELVFMIQLYLIQFFFQFDFSLISFKKEAFIRLKMDLFGFIFKGILIEFA